MSTQQQKKPDKYPLGMRTIRAFQEALQLGDRAVSRLVLDIEMGKPVTVYVEEYVGEEKLAALVGELPNIQPQFVFTDRLKVENAGGTKIVVKQIKTPDSAERDWCLALLDRLKTATVEERQTLQDAIWPPEPEEDE